jgi:hypothetical protein
MYGVIQCKMGTVYGEYEIYYLEKKLGKIHFNIVKLMLLVENKVNFFLIYFYFIFEMFPDCITLVKTWFICYSCSSIYPGITQIFG